VQELPLRVYDVIILLKTSPSHVARRSRLASPSHLDSHTRCVLSAHMSAHLSLSAQSLQLSCAPGAVSSSQVSSTSTISVPGAHGERSALQLRHRLFPVPHVRQRTEVDRTPLRSRRIPARKRGSHCSGTCFAPALEPLQREASRTAELRHATLKELVGCALLLERVLHLKEVGTFCGR